MNLESYMANSIEGGLFSSMVKGLRTTDAYKESTTKWLIRIYFLLFGFLMLFKYLLIIRISQYKY